jgi:glyoxylase-like metal-dependent hydrolase (beta-lactamase superfamily II)
MMRPWRTLAFVSGAAALLLGAALTFAPTSYATLSVLIGWRPSLAGPSPLPPTPSGKALGKLVAGRWLVQQIAPDTWALGEPANDPDNYEYLLVGKSRALLIDAGMSRDADIRPVLASLTRLPVTVIPTHLHSDHTHGLKYFTQIALVDLPLTRTLVQDGQVHVQRLQYMAPVSDPAPVFAVSEWVRPEGDIDLGGRKVRLLWTPGHTDTSISIHDPAAHLLFTGDLIYTTTLYAFMPESSLSTYVKTADRLLATLPADTTLYGAHCCRNDMPAQAPWLMLQDLRDVRQASADILAGKAQGKGVLMRRFPVNSRMTLETFYPFGNQ